MERPNERRGAKTGNETGQEKKMHGARGRGQRRAQGYRAGEQEGRKRAGQEREEPDKGEQMCEGGIGRGRGGRLELGKGGGRFAGRGGRELTNGGGSNGVRVNVGGKGGGADAQRVNGRDAGRGGGQRGRGRGGRGRSRGEGAKAQRGGLGRNGESGADGREGVNGRDAGRGGGQRGGTDVQRVNGRDAGRGGGQRGGADVQRVNGRGGGQRGGGGRGRGRSRGEGAKAQRGGLGRNGEPGADGREEATGGVAEMDVRRRGQSLDARGGRRGERGGGLRDRQERKGGRSNSTERARAPQGRHLGYKKLEILSEKDPSLVAIALSSNPALPDTLRETTMRQDLVELLCLVLSKAFKSQTDRGSLQRLAGIIKDSGFFRTVLPHYVASMRSEVNSLRRAQCPQHLENILAILFKVLKIFPAGSVEAVSLLLTLLEHSMKSLSALGADIQPQMEETVEGLQAQVRHLQRGSREGALTTGEGEQEDFWNKPIYPTHEELQLDHRPFLRPNLTSERYKDTHHYLDTQFRLLREDFVKPLRDGIQEFLWNHIEPGKGNKRLKAKHFDNFYVYFDTRLVVLNCTNTGLAYTVQFDIKPLKSVPWQNSKRLLNGSLVCLSCDHFESFLFATVSDRDLKDLMKGQVQIMFTEESRLKLADIQKDQVFLMIESTAFFEAYRYVLEGLQEQAVNSLPFQRYIVECSTNVQPPAYLRRQDKYDLSSIAEPKYQKSTVPFRCLEAGAWPKMEVLGLDESQMKALRLALTKELAIIQGPPGTGKTHVGLKIARALLNNGALWGNKFGTGTMLIVCYTNHALDQFLEGIHKFLENGIVRVGGCSKSEILKPFNLRELSCSPNCRLALPPHLSLAYREIKRELYDEERNILSQNKKLECSLKGILHENVLKTFISERHWYGLQLPTTSNQKSRIMEWLNLGSIVFLRRETETSNRNEAAPAEEAMELEEEGLIEIAEEADLIQAERIIEDNIGPRRGRDDRMKEAMKSAVREVEELMLALNLDADEIQAEQSEGEWEMQRDPKMKLKNEIRKELRKSSDMTEEEENLVLNVWVLSLPDRWRLYRLWVARFRSELRTSALKSEEAYQNAVERLADVRRHESLCILRKAKVIGMTTTGAAKYRRVLQEVGPRLVIVEEAAQVLEAHTITTLSEACQHLILIGDHQQLQPSTTVYELGKRYNMKISMFERLVKMGLPFVRLNYQHRMRPEIARLLTPHIYPELENHPSVLDFEKIKGIKTSIFFVEHNYPEEIGDGTSHQNQHEAMFVVALCRYLLFQDYKPEQITILTTYNSQLYCLHKLMPASQFAGVQVHVVDKYQGEENDIVLLSLVRSNMQGKVGFLSISNRVCVALSRARKGLYFVGSSATLGKVKLWSNIFQTLRENDQIGKALTLYCQNHPNRQVEAACAEDFKQAPEGGCTKPCQFILDCDHVCQKVCHPYDPEHKKYKCLKKCQRILCDLGHRCPLECHRECPQKCPVKVEKIIPQCQHTQMVPCHQDPETFECKKPCQKILMCGHPCDSTCGGQCTGMCNVKVTLELNCGHSQQDACFYQTQTEKPACRTPCVQKLKCGHPCRGNCAKCYQGRFHVLCFLRCERLLVCSHMCSKPCFCDGSSCKRRCENRCDHSKCLKPCGQPCTPCTEPCTWQCPHQRCSKLCHEPCDRSPCSQPCANTLDCGHPCIGLCGEKCPSKCRICNHDEFTELLNGTEDGPEAYFIQLEDCGHRFEYTAMDKYMGMNDNEQANEEEVARSLKECPKCFTPIRKNLRYGSHIKRSLAKIETVKVKINGHPADIAKRSRALKKQCKESRDMLQQYGYMHISSRLGEPNITPNDLWVLENQMDFLTRVAKLLTMTTENMSTMQCIQFESNVAEFVHWLGDVDQNFTDQQVFDLQRQLRRLTFLAELNVCCHEEENRWQRDEIPSEVQTITQVLEKSGQFNEQDEQRVKETMKELNQKLPLAGLGIGEEDRKWILSTRKMPSRHWYK